MQCRIAKKKSVRDFYRKELIFLVNAVSLEMKGCLENECVGIM